MRTVVLETPQTVGPSSTPDFTIAQGPYEIGYAYDCQAAPAGQQSFEIVVVTASGPEKAPTVLQKELKGSGSRAVAKTGLQSLKVETAAACQWVLKVIAP
jgi:hypothetical protein